MRKNLISTNSYKKSKNKTLELIKANTNSLSIFRYILKECEDITEKSICKLAYFINGFHLAFYGKSVINQETNIVENQPYYKNIVIDTLKFAEKPTLSVTEKLVADNVIKYLGRYSGKMLTNLVLSEPPIINASVKCEKTINEQEIKAYFEKVLKKYDMLSPADIRVFVEEKIK